MDAQAGANTPGWLHHPATRLEQASTDVLEKKMTEFWVAMVSDMDIQTAAQVYDSEISAVYWLARQIPDAEWSAFYDALEPEERTGIRRDANAMDPADLLTAWVGEPEGELTWHGDLATYKVEKQKLYTKTV